jgi:hypothetical protein
MRSLVARKAIHRLQIYIQSGLIKGCDSVLP